MNITPQNLRGSVGRGGANLPADVRIRLVQELLNRHIAESPRWLALALRGESADLRCWSLMPASFQVPQAMLSSGLPGPLGSGEYNRRGEIAGDAGFRARRENSQPLQPKGEHDIEAHAGVRDATVSAPRTLRVRAGRTMFVVAQVPCMALAPLVQSSKGGAMRG